MTDDIAAIAELGGAAAIEMVASALADRGANAAKCPNCSAPVIGPYCAACGQERETHRRSVWRLLHAFIEEIASFDSRILRTISALLLRPGELSVAFREGRTRRYVPALRLYLFVSLIFFVALSAAGIALLQLELVSNETKLVADSNHKVFVVDTKGKREPMEGFTSDDKGNVYFSEPDVPKKLITGLKADGTFRFNMSLRPYFFSRLGTIKTDPRLQAKVMEQINRDTRVGDTMKSPLGIWISQHVAKVLRALASDPAAVNEPLTEWIPRLLFIMLPLFALVLACFYWRQRKKFYFVDHLVFSLNYHSYGFALLLVAAALAQVFSNDTVASLVSLGLGLYLLLAMKRFYGQGWFWTSTKFVFVGFLYLCFLLPALLTVLLIGLWRM